MVHFMFEISHNNLLTEVDQYSFANSVFWFLQSMATFILVLVAFMMSTTTASNCPYGICTSQTCQLSCDSYCEVNTQNPDCCCDDIIESGLDCDANDPPCLESTMADQSLIFGFSLPIGSPQPQTPITMTLFWNNSRFQCTINNHIQLGNYYHCDTSNSLRTHKCSTVLQQNGIDTALQIEMEPNPTNPYNLTIHQIIIKQIKKHVVSNLYIIDAFDDTIIDNHTLTILDNDPSVLITLDNFNYTHDYIMNPPVTIKSQEPHSQCSTGIIFSVIFEFMISCMFTTYTADLAIAIPGVW